MTRKSRFDFLNEVAAEPTPSTSEATTPTPSTPATDTPYLFQQHPRTEAQAPLGNRVRLPAKHALEDYVRDLKRAGYPATEARVLEALMLTLRDDPDVRSKVTTYLTGKPE